MKSDRPLLIQVFRNERPLQGLRAEEWDLLIRQARRCRLVGKLYYLAEEQQVLKSLPHAIFRHLESARAYADKQFRDFLWEVSMLKKAFAGSRCSLLFLKGGGYAVERLPPFRGRVFSDIDLLVPFEELADAEKRLMLHGWLGDKQDGYDQRYYRQWMHEVPPLRHARRGSVVDLHHNILPRTAAACPDARLLLEAAEYSTADPEVKVLSSLDMIIHSATHLFYEGELEHGLRDLLDLHELVAELDSKKRVQLAKRSAQLGLETPVYYALRYLHLILNMSGLDEPIQELLAEGVSLRGMKLMDVLYTRALMPDHPSCDDLWTPLARWLLYVRAHWLRMPWYLLLPHLSRKAWMRLVGTQQH